MDASSATITVLLTLLLFTTFVKIATVLSICRYGLGLVGFEFGCVCLVVSLGLAIFFCHPELTALGLPEALISRPQSVQPQAVQEALLPFMQRRTDASIQRYLQTKNKDAVSSEGADQPGADSKSVSLRDLAPAFLLSELKQAFQVGCLLLIPLVVIDLLAAHVLALVGMQQLAASVVSLPLKILVFIAAGGWGLLGRKLIGVE
jgi:flagellar biosynthesis protein FliP